MNFNRIITSKVFHKVIQLESLSKTTVFANSCKLPQFGRTFNSFANTKQCLNSSTINNRNNLLAKFPTTTTLDTQISRNVATTTGDHVRLWVLEKLFSAALPIVIPAALITENSILDGVMSVLVVMHTHWGLEAIITDYARPNILGPVLPKIMHFSLLILSAVTLCGLFVLINNGPGVAKSIKDLWAIGKNPPSSTTEDT